MPTLDAMFKLLDGYSSTIKRIVEGTDRASKSILGASKRTDDFNDALKRTEAATARASNGLSRLVKTAVGLTAVKKGMDLADTYTNTNARLGMITNSLAEQRSLQNDIFAAANRARGSYTEMASAASKMRMLAGDSFGSNQEAIAFTELLTKSLKVSGAGTAEQNSAFLQISQAMAAGRLQGDEFRSVMENAPMVADAIAQYMGKSKGELKELSSQGLITADIIKNAMFQAAGDIEGKFNTMPMTFGDVGTMMLNSFLETFGGGFEKVSGMLNSSSFGQILDGWNAGLSFVSGGFNTLVDAIVAGGPIVQTFFSVAIIMAGLWASKMFLAAGATMLAHWPLLLIVGVIGMIILALNSAGVSFSSTFSFIGGLLGTFYALGYNIVAGLWNLFVSFAEFLANVFTNPLASIVNLFVNMSISVLNVIKSIAEAIDAVFGSNLSGAVGQFISRGQNFADGFKDSNYVSLDAFRMDSKSTIGAIQGGLNAGKALGGFVDNWNFSGISGINPDAGGTDYSQFFTAGNPAVVKGTGKGGAVKVEADSEDIEWMRKLAERDYVARIAQNTLAPNIRVEFSGPITKETDTDSVMTHVVNELKDIIATAPEGVPV
jgi:tape measure domain-containing protein